MAAVRRPDLERQNQASSFIDRIIDICAFLYSRHHRFNHAFGELRCFHQSILNRPTIGMLELNEYALLFAAFFSAPRRYPGGQTRDRGHRGEPASGPKARAIQETIVSVLGAGACAWLAWYSARATWDHFLQDAHPGAILRVPRVCVRRYRSSRQHPARHPVRPGGPQVHKKWRALSQPVERPVVHPWNGMSPC